MHSDKFSNSMHLLEACEPQSQEAQSLYLQEESDNSLLYDAESKKFAFTEQSKQLLAKLSKVGSREDSDSSSGEESKARPKQRKKKSSNLLSKIKSAGVLPRPKKKEKPRQKQPLQKAEEQKEVRKKDSKSLVNKKRARRKTLRPKEAPASPKKSARKMNLNSGLILAPVQGLGISNEEESNHTVGLSIDSHKSLNSSNIVSHKKTRTLGYLGRGKNRLSKKATQVLENAKTQSICYWNIFIAEGPASYQQHYKTIKKIGQGGCGEVLMVMHLPTDQIRAMKIIRKNSEKVVSSVFDEINVLRQLDHPNIVKVFEYFQDEQNLYIIMEHLKGGSLFDRLKAVSRFGEREAAYVMKQVLQALNYCQSKRIVHRDMKLENILFVQEDAL